MLVTRWNQSVALDDFKLALAKCEFCAFDEEMTGVDSLGRSIVLGDQPEMVYKTRKEACEAFSAFQFGIALFIRSPTNENAFDVMPYNFFLLNATGDVRLDLKTIPFHNTNAMDFQKWLTSGMRYCTAREEEELRDSFGRVAPLRADEDKQALERIVLAVEAWYNGSAAEPSSEEEGETPLSSTLTISESCGYAVAKWVKHVFTTCKDLPVTVRYEGKPYFGENMVFTFEKLDREAWQTLRGNHRQDAERRLSSMLGFREFWKAITESKKPMVGHNCFQDLLFMLHMHEAKLPESYDEFKKLAHETFPAMYDTKTLATTLKGEHAFAQTHLGAVYAEVRRRFHCVGAENLRQHFRLPPGFYDYDEGALGGQGKAHEAGYDAYMTGICYHFLRQLHGDKTKDYESVLSAFGSVYFCCLTERKDRLVIPATFVITSDAPFHLEQLEALLFVSESRDNITADGRVDVRKLNYKANRLVVDEADMCTAACVVFSSSETVQSVKDKLRLAASGARAENVRRDLVEHLDVHQASHT